MTTSDILSIIAAVLISIGSVVAVILWHILSRRRARNNDTVNVVGKNAK